MYALGILLYVLACGTVAWLLAKLLTRRVTRPWARWAVTAALAPVVFLLPLADEIVGYFQFERLCESAKEVKVYGTIPVGADLYTPDGKWRLALQDEDGFRLRNTLQTYIRHRDMPPRDVGAAMPIQLFERQLYDARSGKLVAEWQHLTTRGGWLSQTLGSPGDKILVPQQCMPKIVWQGHALYTSVLVFNAKQEAIK